MRVAEPVDHIGAGQDGHGPSGAGHDAAGGPQDELAPAASAPRADARAAIFERALLLLSLLTGALTHGYHLFRYPLYITDEGIYLQQAWAVLREARLSPYTYFYDHAPAGWLVIAAWLSVLPSQLQTFGNAINTGRALMLLAHLGSVFFLFRVTRRLAGSPGAAFAACLLFNLSPLALFYQRQVLLDNLMVFWLLLSLYLATLRDRRVITPLLGGLAFGLSVLTKENAVFFAPVVGYLLYCQVRRQVNYRFALGFGAFAGAASVSTYFLYAQLKNELFPSGFNFDLNNPPADHVSLLYTVWWQLHRSQGSILDRNSLVWRFSLGSWLPKDTFILAAGLVATLLALAVGLWDRRRRADPSYLVAALLAASYAFYLFRGSVMLEFYVVPLLPFLAMNIGMVGSRLLQWAPALARGGALVAFVGLLVLHPTWGYFLKINEDRKVVPQDLYMLSLTEMQAAQLQFVRETIPPTAKVIIDDDLWPDLHDVRPYYKWAHSHWKAAADPDVRDKLYAKDWRNIDYIVLSNKMRLTMEQNNGDGGETWILDGLDHAEQVWSLEHGDIKLEVYRVVK
ncbi:MAG TPA: glycosyltransferase family 39 protein [Vicinamibacteria bacterium]